MKQINSRFVFDTNILVSAILLKQSIPRTAFEKSLAQGRILASLATADELQKVFARSKFNRYLSLAER
jgi:predicted nucleic acid-binding protein